MTNAELESRYIGSVPQIKRSGAPALSSKLVLLIQILQEYPRLEPVMEEIWPKKAAPVLLKW